MADFPLEITKREVARWLAGRADRSTVVHKADCILADILELIISWDEGNTKWEKIRKLHPSRSGRP